MIRDYQKQQSGIAKALPSIVRCLIDPTTKEETPEFPRIARTGQGHLGDKPSKEILHSDSSYISASSKPGPIKGAYGGRGSGKSHFFAELMVEECIREPGTLAVCIRETQKTLRESAKR